LTDARPGRNDPCPCGSGKKYKNCCLSKSRADHVRSSRWREEEQETLDKLLSFARRPEMSPQSTAAFNLFWNGSYGLGALRLMDKSEVGRFLDWYVFDYRLEGSNKRIIDLFGDEAATRLLPAERERIRAWGRSYPSLYRIARIATDSSLDLVDVFQGEATTVSDLGLGHVAVVGDLILGRVLRSSTPPHLSWAALLLPSEMEASFAAFVRLGYSHHQETHSENSWPGFLSSSGYILNHYMLKAAVEPGRARPAKRAYYDALSTVEKLHQAESELREEMAKRAGLVRKGQGMNTETQESSIRQTTGGVLLPGNVHYKERPGQER